MRRNELRQWRRLELQRCQATLREGRCGRDGSASVGGVTVCRDHGAALTRLLDDRLRQHAQREPDR